MNNTHEDASLYLPHCLFSGAGSMGDELARDSDNKAYLPLALQSILNCNSSQAPPAAESSFALPSPAATPASSQLTSFPLLFPPFPLSQPEPAPMAPAKRRRNCGLTMVEKLRQKAIRVQKNRKFARESRDRKRLYVQGLEKEVAELREELAQLKQKFSSYELIERHRAMEDGVWKAVISNVVEEVKRGDLDHSQFAITVMNRMDQVIEERKQVLTQLSRMVLQLVVPPLMRLAFWEVESKVDRLDPYGVCKRLGYESAEEESETLTARLMKSLPGVKFEEGRKQVAMRLQRVRKSVKQMLQSQSEIVGEQRRLWQRGKTSFMLQYTMDHAAQELKLIPRLCGRPELSDQAILHVQDQDFTADTTSTASEMDVAANQAIEAIEANRAETKAACAII